MPNDSNQLARGLAVLSTMALLCCLACGAVTRQVAKNATPAVVDSGIEAGLSEKNQEAVVEAIDPERVERATEKVAAAATDGWTTAITQEERQARVAAAVAPMVASLVHESMQTALSDEHLARVRELAKQATLGFQDAIDEVTQKREEGTIPSDKGNVLQAVDNVAEGGSRALYVLGALAAVLAVLLGLGAVWVLGRKRRYQRESARRDQALEAAVRMLSREGMPLDASRIAGAEDGTDIATQTDAELVRSTARRMRRAPEEGGATKKGTTA